MMMMVRRCALALALVLALATAARAEDEAVTVILRSGDKVTGVFVGVREKRYRIRIGDQTIELRPADILRIEFGAAKSEPAPPAPRAEAKLADLIPTSEELPKGFTVVSREDDANGFSIVYQERGRLRYVARTDHEVAPGKRGLGFFENEEVKDLSVDAPPFHVAILEWEDLTSDESIVSAAGLDAFRKLVEEKITKARGPVRIDGPRGLVKGLPSSSLVAPEWILPSGVTPAGPVAPSDIAPLASFAGMTKVEGQRYRCASGSITLLRYWRKIEFCPQDDVFRPPTERELRRYRAVWLGAGAPAVALVAKGSIPKGTLEWFERFVDAELARCADTREARRIEIPEPKVAIVDLIPRIEELPRGFSPDAKKTEIMLNGGRASLQERALARLSFRERGEANVALIEANEGRERAERDGLLTLLAGEHEPAEILRAGRFFATIQGGICTLEGLAELRRLIEMKLRDASGETEVERETLPILLERFARDQLLIPQERLPAGVEVAKTENVHAIFYRVGPASITLAVDTHAIETWGDDWKRDVEVSWVGRDVWVALSSSGGARADVAALLVKHVEAELERAADTRGAKRVDLKPEAPSKTITVEDLVPALEELPKGFRIARRTMTGRLEIKNGIDELKKSPPPFMSPEVIAAAIESSEGLKERLDLVLEERAEIGTTVHEYETADAAQKAYRVFYRGITNHPEVVGLGRALYQADRFLAVVHDRGTTTDAASAVDRQTYARFAKLGTPKVDRFPVKRAPVLDENAKAPALAIPDHFLPDKVRPAKGVVSSGLDGTIFARFGSSRETPLCAQRAYHVGEGTVVITVVGAEKSNDFAAASASDLARFRDVWIFGEPHGARAITLEVRGDVPADVVAWFAADVDRVLARSADGMSAKRFDQGASPGPGAAAEKLDDTLEVEWKGGALLVAGVKKGSRWSGLGVQPGDEIMEWVVGDAKSRETSIAAFRREVLGAERGSEVRVELSRRPDAASQKVWWIRFER